MVMTFVLHQLSHYNSITEPRARFLLSFLERLTIDFFSHFILSLIDVYRDTATYDKLIFPLAITWILRHFSLLSWVSSFFDHVCHRRNYYQPERGPTLTEVATDRDSDSSSFFRPFHINTFFIGEWCDPRGGHGAAATHECSPWHT